METTRRMPQRKGQNELSSKVYKSENSRNLPQRESRGRHMSGVHLNEENPGGSRLNEENPGGMHLKEGRRTKAVRNTPQKEIVFKTLSAMSSHPTPSMVYERVREEHPGISRSTVYRILAQLAEQGRILKLTVTDSDIRYDHNYLPHYHIRCRSCGKVSDLNIPYRPELIGEARKATDFTVENHFIEFTGLCRECREHG